MLFKGYQWLKFYPPASVPKVFNSIFLETNNMEKIKDLETWIITGLVAFLLIFGIFYFKILESVDNPLAFMISLTVIFLILIAIIVNTTNKKQKSEETPPKEKAVTKPVVKKKVAKKKAAKKKSKK